eukprot:441495-Rhodomonas_salina.2
MRKTTNAVLDVQKRAPGTKPPNLSTASPYLSYGHRAWNANEAGQYPVNGSIFGIFVPACTVTTTFPPLNVSAAAINGSPRSKNKRTASNDGGNTLADTWRFSRWRLIMDLTVRYLGPPYARSVPDIA